MKDLRANAETLLSSDGIDENLSKCGWLTFDFNYAGGKIGIGTTGSGAFLRIWQRANVIARAVGDAPLRRL